ncbi:hypothetical protein E2C01_034135 [Portunus trituberculatus]|uniref:Uncharacterized protein n=1 Tax=Portunus trituberculatus TaxID=210409 RepID=A0A5B7F205_PORTR|nr:hypothetical protein [Portunus trituberculatus]
MQVCPSEWLVCCRSGVGEGGRVVERAWLGVKRGVGRGGVHGASVSRRLEGKLPWRRIGVCRMNGGEQSSHGNEPQGRTYWWLGSGGEELHARLLPRLYCSACSFLLRTNGHGASVVMKSTEDH